MARLVHDRLRAPAPAELVNELRLAGVERLIDVRHRPESRRPGMSKPFGGGRNVEDTASPTSTARARVRRRTLRCSFQEQARGRGREAFRGTSRTASAAELEPPAAELDRAPATALMCLEADAGCHRRVPGRASAAPADSGRRPLARGASRRSPARGPGARSRRSGVRAQLGERVPAAAGHPQLEGGDLPPGPRERATTSHTSRSGAAAHARDRRVVEQPQQPPVRERQDRPRARPGARRVTSRTSSPTARASSSSRRARGAPRARARPLPPPGGRRRPGREPCRAPAPARNSS